MREEAGLQPDIVSYNALMRVLLQHGKVDEALEVYMNLQEEEGNTAAKSAPDCATYTVVVGALCKEQRWSEAEDVLYDGVKRQKVPDLGRVPKLVHGLKEAGKGRAARRVVVGLQKKFPEHFDGPWREFEEVTGLTPGTGKVDDEGEEEDEQQLPQTVAAA